MIFYNIIDVDDFSHEMCLGSYPFLYLKIYFLSLGLLLIEFNDPKYQTYFVRQYFQMVLIVYTIVSKKCSVLFVISLIDNEN